MKARNDPMGQTATKSHAKQIREGQKGQGATETFRQWGGMTDWVTPVAQDSSPGYPSQGGDIKIPRRWYYSHYIEQNIQPGSLEPIPMPYHVLQAKKNDSWWRRSWGSGGVGSRIQRIQAMADWLESQWKKTKVVTKWVYALNLSPGSEENILIMDSAADQSVIGQGFKIMFYMGQQIKMDGALVRVWKEANTQLCVQLLWLRTRQVINQLLLWSTKLLVMRT